MELYGRNSRPPGIGGEATAEAGRRGAILAPALVMLLIACLSLASAANSPSLSELAQEAEQRCRETAGSPPDRETVVEAVDTACLLLQMEGMDAIRHFRGGDSPFIFGGAYIWIHDLSGLMIVHPIRHELEGLNVIGLKDAKGHRLFAEMNAAVLESGSAWVSYHWPRPGDDKVSAKRSYVRLCEVNGRMVVVGCGVNIAPDDEEAEETQPR